jgi:hypothetical protein
VTSKEGKGKMKPLMNGRLVIAVLTVACLTIVLLTVAPIRSGSPSAGEYDPWLDWNDDGEIDMKDVSRVAKAFGTSGQNISKASLMYDSGWLDLRNETGEYYTITHNLNDSELQVDARREITLGWNRTYGGASDDWAYALVQTSDGGYALTGWTWSFGAGNGDFWLVKTDALGTMQWNRTYGGTNEEHAYALVQTTDGGYAIAGYTYSLGAGNWDFWLVKTDAAGTEQWNRTYGGTNSDWAFALVQTSDGGYALTGWTWSFGAGFYDVWLVKTDASGNMMWNRTYGGTNRDVAGALVQTTDGGYAIAGITSSFGAGASDCWLIKTDASGNMMWNRTYGGTNEEHAYDLVQTTDGGYAIAGYTRSYGAGNADFWLVKTDASGNALWNKTYGGTGEDYAYALVRTSDGGYALAGGTGSFGAGGYDAWLVKTDASGNMQWNKTYGGASDDWAYALVQTSDGGYAIAGYTDSYGAGSSDFWLIKTDASGNVGGVESGLAWTYSSPNTVTLYRGATDTNWNYVRVRLWKPRETP